jgi:hypothetical protein
MHTRSKYANFCKRNSMYLGTCNVDRQTGMQCEQNFLQQIGKQCNPQNLLLLLLHNRRTVLLPTCTLHNTSWRMCKHDSCVSVILHVIILNCDCGYTITLVINMKTDNNNIFGFMRVPFLAFGFQSHNIIYQLKYITFTEFQPLAWIRGPWTRNYKTKTFYFMTPHYSWRSR